MRIITVERRMKHRLLMNIILPTIIIGSCTISVFAKTNRNLSDYVISKPIDLKGSTLTIPDVRRLFFKKGTRLTNGIIVGNNTSIGGSRNDIFNNVQITGSWNVSHISTVMFGDMSKNNSLVNVFALTSKNVKNVVMIASGDYWITISEDWR